MSDNFNGAADYGWPPIDGYQPFQATNAQDTTPRYVSSLTDATKIHTATTEDVPIRPESSISNRSFQSQVSIDTSARSSMGARNTSQPYYTYRAANNSSTDGSEQSFSGPQPALDGTYRYNYNNIYNAGPYNPYTSVPMQQQQYFGASNGTTGYASCSNDSRNPSNHGIPVAASDKAKYIMEGACDNGDDVFVREGPSPHRRNSMNSTPDVGVYTPTRNRAGDLRSGSRTGTAMIPMTPSFQLASLPEVQNMPAQGTYIKDNIETTAPPAWFKHVGNGTTAERMPKLDDAFIDMPFSQQFKEDVHASTCGFIKISNVPFSVTRNEILAHLGRSARIVPLPPNSPYYSVHIMMERMTGKTMDCFVEVCDAHEARHLVMASNRRASTHRTPKIGDRHVVLELSNQEEFMATLFPKAKDTRWIGAMPHVEYRREEVRPGVWTQGFKGFLQMDEINMFVKYATSPMRSPFIQRSPNRVYECLITTLHKYPWYASEYVLMNERRMLGEATNCLIKILAQNLVAGSHDCPPQLTHNLLQEVVVAGMTCPGFGERQKAGFAHTLRSLGYTRLADGSDIHIKFGGVHPYSTSWPFMALNKSPTARDDFVEYYVSLIRSASTGSDIPSLSQILAQRRGLRAQALKPFGDLMIDYKTEDMGSMSLEACANKELEVLQSILASVLPRTAGA